MKSANEYGRPELGGPDRALRRRAEQPRLRPLGAPGQRARRAARTGGCSGSLSSSSASSSTSCSMKSSRAGRLRSRCSAIIVIGSVPGRAADAEVDALRVEAAQDAEHLGDLERAVVRQHHPAAPDADALGGVGDRADQDLRRRARERRSAVVLGDPVAVVAERLDVAAEVDAPLKRLRGRRALGDRGLVEDAEAHSAETRGGGPGAAPSCRRQCSSRRSACRASARPPRRCGNRPRPRCGSGCPTTRGRRRPRRPPARSARSCG